MEGTARNQPALAENGGVGDSKIQTAAAEEALG